MKLIAATIPLLILLSVGRCQSQPQIVKIEFSTMTRGYQKQLFISADSATRIIEDRQTGNKILKRRVAEDEWKNFVSSLENVDLRQLDDLPSPTSKRTFDGARESTLKIITSDGNESQHVFDNEDPHDKLQPLMDLISAFDKKFSDN